MEQNTTFTGTSVEEVWQQVNNDFAAGVSINDYRTSLVINNQTIELSIMSSPGGSEEGGYDTTRMSAYFNGNRGFHFAIHPEDFLNKIGKLFGMEDVTTGYPEFDKNVMVKTNDPSLFKNIFSEQAIREVFQTLSGYSFKIVPHNENEGDHLELYIQHAISDANELRPVFNAFCRVAMALNR